MDAVNLKTELLARIGAETRVSGRLLLTEDQALTLVSWAYNAGRSAAVEEVISACSSVQYVGHVPPEHPEHQQGWLAALDAVRNEAKAREPA